MKNMKKMFSGWLLTMVLSVTAVFAQGTIRTAESAGDNAYWGQAGKNPENQTVTALPVAIVADSLFEKWNVTNVYSNTQVVMAGDYLYGIVEGGIRELRKISIEDGIEDAVQTIWSEGDLVYGDGKVFVSQGLGYGKVGIFAFDAETLDTLWLAECETEDSYGTDNPLVYADGYIYGGFSGHYYCFSTADPDPDSYDETIEPVWHKSGTGFGVLEGIISTIVGDDIYLGLGTKMLRLNRKTGEELGSLTVDDNIYGGSSYDAATERLLFKDESNKLYSIKVGATGFDMDSKKETTLTRLSFNNSAAPTVYNGRVYATGEQHLYVLNVETLELIYTYELGKYDNNQPRKTNSQPLVCTAFATAENNHKVYVYIQSNKAGLICIEDFEGNTEASEVYIAKEYQYMSSMNGLLMDQNGTLYCYDGSRGLYAYESRFAATGIHIDGDAEIELYVGQTKTLKVEMEPLFATNKQVTWTSSNEAVATVSEAGLVTAVAEGEAFITATSEDGGFTAQVTITVSQQIVAVTGVTLDKPSAELTVGGEALQLTATVAPAEATDKTVTWTSSNEAVATVSESGLVTAVAAGESDITVTTTDGNFTAVCKVTVRVAVTGVTLSQAEAELTVGGETQQLTATVAPAEATDKTVTWTSSDVAVATVSATGLVTAVAAGEADITVTTVDGNFTAVCKVMVKEAEDPTVAVTGVMLSQTEAELTMGGEALQLTATVAPANATNKNVTWTSSNEAVATVSEGGLVTAVAAGEADITVTTTDGNFTAVCKVTVKEAEEPTVAVTGVTLDKTVAELTVGGEALQLTATVAPAEATDKTVTWTSSDVAVATVSATGLVTAVVAGEADITVTTADGNFTAVCKVTVKAKPTANESLDASLLTSAYPNPTTGLLYVEVAEPAVLELLTTDGRHLFRKEVGAGTVTLTLEKNGLYILRVTAGDRVAVQRIVKR